MMHFPPCFIFPLFPKDFLTPWKISQILPFPEKLSRFHPPKFLMTFFLVINHKFRIPPVFANSIHFPPISTKLFFPPYFCKIPPDFVKLTCFYILYMYFYHTMHVLDAPGPIIGNWTQGRRDCKQHWTRKNSTAA